jgi:hypothetical protein
MAHGCDRFFDAKAQCAISTLNVRFQVSFSASFREYDGMGGSYIGSLNCTFDHTSTFNRIGFDYGVLTPVGDPPQPPLCYPPGCNEFSIARKCCGCGMTAFGTDIVEPCVGGLTEGGVAITFSDTYSDAVDGATLPDNCIFSTTAKMQLAAFGLSPAIGATGSATWIFGLDQEGDPSPCDNSTQAILYAAGVMSSHPLNNESATVVTGDDTIFDFDPCNYTEFLTPRTQILTIPPNPSNPDELSWFCQSQITFYAA